MNFNIFIIAMDIIAFICLLGATNMLFLIHKKTRKVSNLWLIGVIALSLISISTLMQVVEHYTQSLSYLIDIIKDVFLIIAVTLIFSVTVIFQKEIIIIKACLDGNLKNGDGKRFKEIKEWFKTIKRNDISK